MKRAHILLSSVAVVLVLALFWLFAYQPQREALAEVEEQIAAEMTMQQQLQAEIDRLRNVRAEAPEIESELAAASAILPREAALPGSLRQIQTAADESGVTLQSVTTGRPVQVEGATAGLSSIAVNASVLGSYFQVVDFLRRIEDPSITPRGLLWTSAALSIDEYPRLSVALTGELYAALEVAPPEVEETAPPADGEPADGEPSGDVTDDQLDAPEGDTEADIEAMEVGR